MVTTASLREVRHKRLRCLTVAFTTGRSCFPALYWSCLSSVDGDHLLNLQQPNQSFFFASYSIMLVEKTKPVSNYRLEWLQCK